MENKHPVRTANMGIVNELCDKNFAYISHTYPDLLMKSNFEEYGLSRLLSAKTKMGKWLEQTKVMKHIRRLEYNSEREKLITG